MRILAALALLAITATPVSAAGTISLASADPAFGKTVTFTVELTGRDAHLDCVGSGRCARVLVECYQDGTLVYGEGGDLGQARGDGTSPLGYSGFLLGGAMSRWVERGGGPADCIATLFRFDNSGKVQEYVPLASVAFRAG